MDANIDSPNLCLDYHTYMVTMDGLPAGVHIIAETPTDARKKLEIAGQRLGFPTTGIDLEATD